MLDYQEERIAELAKALGERTAQVEQLRYENLLMLSLLGKIATAPMMGCRYDAEKLLNNISHPEYARQCEWCNDVPASPTKSGKTLCSDCSQEEEEVCRVK